jgi:signal transduction histidine kinase
MGLGLAICQSIIESHGGVLRFKKNPPGGTIFSFTLPIIPETKV